MPLFWAIPVSATNPSKLLTVFAVYPLNVKFSSKIRQTDFPEYKPLTYVRMFFVLISADDYVNVLDIKEDNCTKAEQVECYDIADYLASQGKSLQFRR